MALRGISLVTLAALAATTVACGSKDDGSGSSDGTTTGDDCSPTGEIPCYKGKAEPCDASYKTDFEGDEFCMKPPDDGWQLHVGPSDYSNPDEVDKYVLAPGAGDVNWCYQMKSQNEQTEYTNQYYAHMRPGSHHFILFALNSDAPDSTAPGDCSQRDSGIVGGATFLAGATRKVQDAAMFGGAPEDEGLASEQPPHQQLSVNLHFVNIGDAPVMQEIWVNMIRFPADRQITQKIKAIEWLGGLGMNIAPGSHVIVPGGGGTSGGGTDCKPPEDIRILGVTAHAHASTTRVAMYRQHEGSATKDLVFEEYNWEEPTVFRYNSKTDNVAPNPTSKTAGSPMSGVFTASPTDQFSWECEITNNRDVNLTFSDKAYDGEMCNVFGMYAAPEPQGPWLCFDLRGGTPVQ